jgi:hypothetical protein
MNWEAVGAVAELIGAFGVIVSLVYLAKQIKANSANISQNTEALLSASDIGSNQLVLELYGPQARSAELAELTLKGHGDFEALSSLEKYRYSMTLLSMFETHQTFFVQTQKGSARQETWDYYEKAFGQLCTLPGVIHWWRLSSDSFNPGFVEYIDAKMPSCV